MITYGLVYLLTALVAVILTPAVARLARALKIVDRPGVRKVHAEAVPRLGGAAVAISIAAGICIALMLDGDAGAAIRASLGQVAALFVAALFICLIGLIDDIRPLSARTKLLAQIIAATAVCAFGIRIEQIGMKNLFVWRFGWLSWPLTVFWIISITNAMNLIDGLDGLAAGISAITCAVIGLFAWYTGRAAMVVLAAVMLGSLTGFLFFNFNPAKIFLGDSGSMFLGFFLATSSVMFATKSAALTAMAVPTLALGVPILDTITSIVRRTANRRSPFQSDRGHIHHRLIEAGMKQRHAVILIYLVTAASAGIGMLAIFTQDAGTLVILAGAMIPLVLVFRMFGAMRFKTIAADWKRTRALNQDAKRLERHLRLMQVRLAEAQNLEQWWRTVRRAARAMGLVELELNLPGSDGYMMRLFWHLPLHKHNGYRRMYVALPIGHDGEPTAGIARAAVELNGSIEASGNRLAKFGRLLDEFGPARFISSCSAQPVEPRGVTLTG